MAETKPLARQIFDFSTQADARIDAKRNVAGGICGLDSDGKVLSVQFPAEAQRNVAGGLCGLDADGKIATAQLPAAALGGLNYRGAWNANTNSPAIVSATGTAGYYYKVSVAGATTIDGESDWSVGDWIIFSGSTWQKVDNTDKVSSVNGYIGAVSLTKSDLSLSDVENTALSTWTGTTQVATLGTVLTGVWSATAIAIAKGGTGATSASDARTNLGLGTMARAAAEDYLSAANNLSNLASASTARTNLGLGTIAVAAASSYLAVTNNLSDLASASTARTNLGLGTIATAATSSYLAAANNLSDLTSATAARTTLGLGSAALNAAGDFAAASHTHAAADVVSGVIAVARLGTGTPTSNTYLRGDGVWATGDGAGDIVGPSSAVNLRVVVFNGTTGKLVSDGGSTVGNLLDRANHTGTQAWATLTGTPTTISGYGITDFNSLGDARYLKLSGGAMAADASVTIAESTGGHDSELSGWGLGVQLSADHSKGTMVIFDGIDTYDGANHLLVKPTGIVFQNGSRLMMGTTDLGIGANKGISLRCSIDYELNWQAGWLTAYGQDGTTEQDIWLRSSLAFGGNAAKTVGMNRHTTSDTAGNSLTMKAGGASNGATNKHGGWLTLSGGISTGTGVSGLAFSAAPGSSSGTADNAPIEAMEVTALRTWVRRLDIRSSAASFDLQIGSDETLTGHRKLAVFLGNANRELTVSGNSDINGNFSGTSSGTNTGDNSANSLYSGIITFPGFGTSGATACVGNDSRLSDARTPVGTALTSANILVGSGSNVAASVAVSGDVTITNAGVTAIGAGKVTNSMLDGSIANAKLSNSAVTIGSTAVSLGATAATVAGLTLTSPTINGGTFTGTPTAPTAIGGTNTTQIATTAFVGAAVSLAVTGLLELKGSADCSTNPYYPAGSVGDTYYVTVAGKIGGASGIVVDIGDTYICQTDNAGGTQSAVGASWFILEHNLVGALLSANNLSDVASASSARSNLGLGTLATQSGTFSGTSSNTNTGDVTLAGENYLSISAQVITAAAVNLSGTHVTGTLADARFPATLPALSGVNLTALNATNIASGTLPAARMPALTGDVTTVAGAVATTIANSAVSLAKMADVATASVFYRKTANAGAPEVNTLATLKTDLGLTGTNSGDQTTIVGITGTKAQFDTAVSDGNILYVGDAVTGVTGTAPVVSSGGTTPAISIPAATAAVAGHMTAAAMTKLDGIATGANLYVHPNHSGVVTSTADGATAIADAALSIAKTSGLQSALDAKQPLDAALTALAAGSDFVQFTGPITSTKIFTLPDASSTLLFSGGALGTPSGGTATNLTGTASGLTAGNVTTNANLTGDVTSVGNATTIGALKVTNAMLEGSIAYSKLVLTGEILDADLAGSIAASKLVGTDISTVGTLSAGEIPTTLLTGTITNAQLAGSIDLTTKVTGVLPIANGGTNASTDSGARTALGLGTIATAAATDYLPLTQSAIPTSFVDLLGNTRAAITKLNYTITGPVTNSTSTGLVEMVTVAATLGTGGSHNYYGKWIQTVVPATNSENLNAVYASLMYNYHYGTGTLQNCYGTYSLAAQALGAGAVTTLVGAIVNASAQASSGVTNQTGLHIAANRSTSVGGTTADRRAIHISALSSGGTITDTYGLYIGSQTAGTQTNLPFSIYSVDANAKMYHAGNVGIGTTSPGNKLSVNTPVAASEASVFITQDGSFNGKGLLVRRSAVAQVVAPVFAVEDSVGNAYFQVGADGSFSGSNGLSSGIFTIGQGGGGPYLKLNFNGGTKHYRLGTDDAQFYIHDEAAALRRLVISAATGNVGIGTTSPGAKLDISSSFPTVPIPLKVTDQSGYGIYIGNRNQLNFDYGLDADTTSGNSGGINYTGYNGGTTRFRSLTVFDGKQNAIAFFDGSTRKVGIGTASPGAQLQVNAGAAGTIGSIIKLAASATANALEVQNSSGTVLAKINSAGSLHIAISPPDNTGTVYGIRSVLTGGANNNLVAGYFSSIGASSNYGLMVVGAVDITGDTLVQGVINTRSTKSSTLGNLFVGENPTNGVYAAGNGGTIVFGGSTAGQGAVDTTFASIGGVKENSTYMNSLGALVFGTQSTTAGQSVLATVTEKMRITSSGNVGIGTTAPDKVCEINLGPSSALRLTYNDANGSATTYMDTTVSSVGLTTFTAAGSAPSFTFANAVAMAASKALTVATGDNYGLKFSGGGTIEEYSNYMVLSAPYTGFIFYSPQTGTNVLTTDNTSATFLIDVAMGAAKTFYWAGTGCSMTGPAALNLVAYQNFDFTTSGGSGRKVFTIENTGVIRSYYAYTNASNYQRFSINQTANSFTLAAETAGTGAANIDVIIAPAGTGKVGIGTTSPANTLHVFSSGFPARFEKSGGHNVQLANVSNSPYWQFLNSANNAVVAAGLDAASLNLGRGNVQIIGADAPATVTIPARLYVVGDGTNPAAIFNTGKVGIGITIPTSTLHVVGDSNLGGFIVSSAGLLTAGTVPVARITGLTNLEAIYNSMMN